MLSRFRTIFTIIQQLSNTLRQYDALFGTPSLPYCGAPQSVADQNTLPRYVTMDFVVALDTCMSSYELNRAIHCVYTDRNNAMAFRRGEYKVLDGFKLTAEEHEALTGRDFPRLWALHVHPVLLFHLSVVLHPREWYITEVVPKIQGVPNQWYDYYAPSRGGTENA
jgi:hypothetical protein